MAVSCPNCESRRIVEVRHGYQVVAVNAHDIVIDEETTVRWLECHDCSARTLEDLVVR